MKSILITGCNRGIGLSFVKQLLNLSTPPEHIFATCRNIKEAEKLNEIARKNSNVHILEIDVKNFNEYNDLVQKVKTVVGDDGLNVLVNNAGVSSRFTRIGLVKVEQMTESLMVNTVAPIMMAKAFLPLLKMASDKNAHLPMSIFRCAIINVSSILGSIEKNTDGGFYPYRCSKAALNMATKSLSIDLRNDKILVICLHPGWLKTDLGGKNAPLEVDETVKIIIHTLQKLKEEHNGSYVQYDGQILPW